MRLDELVDGTETFVHFERYVNFESATRTSMLGELDPRYSAHLSSGSIEIPLFRTESYESVLTKRAVRTRHPIGEDMIAIHPQALDEYLKTRPDQPESSIHAYPTASHRTLLIEDGSAFLKLSLPFRISSTDRTLKKHDAFASVRLSDRIIETLPETSRFGIYPDLRAHHARGWTHLERSAEPWPERNEEVRIPLIGMLAQTDSEPLIVQIAKKRASPVEDVVLEDIVVPLLQAWNWFAIEASIIPHLHGQNMVARYDGATNRITMLDVRDFQGRRDLMAEDLDRSTELGISYDFITGYLLFDRTINSLEPWIDAQRLRSGIATLFHEYVSVGDLPPRQIRYAGLGSERHRVTTALGPAYR